MSSGVSAYEKEREKEGGGGGGGERRPKIFRTGKLRNIG